MTRSDAEISMRKSLLLLASAATGVGLTATAIVGSMQGAAAFLSAGLLLAVALVLGLLAAAALLAIRRQRRIEVGQPDLFLQYNERQSEGLLRAPGSAHGSAIRRLLGRVLFGHRLLVGDWVKVRSLAEIRATLDGEDCLDGLPFMAEMESACEKSFRIYRVVEKVYDYGRTRRMRRLDDCVLLLDQRCDGMAHAGCEAACYLIWKLQWLVPLATARVTEPVPSPCAVAPRPSQQPEPLSCQYTRLSAASRHMHPLSLHGLVGPLVVGNVTMLAFVTALATRAFNAFQAWRGGAQYPAKPTPSDDKSIRGESLQSGDWVRVKLPADIARAMDRNSKNRGLWFDRDMLKHAGQRYQVRGRINKIIDVNTGALIAMKTPCIVLAGLHYSGEFQGFGEQHDYLYWRESWLERIDGHANDRTRVRDSAASRIC
jgi:hypothetical protein